MSHPSRLLLPLAALGLLLLAACAPAGPQLIGNPQNPYPLTSSPKVGEFVHLPTGIPVTFDQLLNVAADARIVYFGETHDNPASHHLEVELLDGLDRRHPGQMVLGLEMFSRTQQPVLDRWVAGELTEKEFLKQSHWFSHWNMNFAYYRDLLNLARERRIPVIALNAEKSLVRDITVKSPAQLTPEQQAQLPEMDFKDPYQRAQTLAILGDHSHGKLGAEGFLRAQTLWDETMAESVARYLDSPAGENRRLLVCAGGNHVRYGFGIPRRVFRRLPLSYTIIGGREIEIPKSKQDRLMDVQLPEFPMVPYDFLAYLEYADLPSPPVKLGVMFEAAKAGPGLVVKQVVPDSNAARAGLQDGDILLQLDGADLDSSFDLIYAIEQKHPGDAGHLRLRRQGKELELDLTFKAGSAHHGTK